MSGTNHNIIDQNIGSGSASSSKKRRFDDSSSEEATKSGGYASAPKKSKKKSPTHTSIISFMDALKDVNSICYISAYENDVEKRNRMRTLLTTSIDSLKELRRKLKEREETIENVDGIRMEEGSPYKRDYRPTENQKPLDMDEVGKKFGIICGGLEIEVNTTLGGVAGNRNVISRSNAFLRIINVGIPALEASLNRIGNDHE